jgi:hypothetical protein
LNDAPAREWGVVFINATSGPGRYQAVGDSCEQFDVLDLQFRQPLRRVDVGWIIITNNNQLVTPRLGA